MTFKKNVLMLGTAAAMTFSVAGTVQAKDIWNKNNLGKIDNARLLNDTNLGNRAEIAARNKFKKFFTTKGVTRDNSGNMHVRMDQRFRGKSIRGADVVMHIMPSGDISLVNGNVVRTGGVPARAKIDADVALMGSASAMGIGNYVLQGDHELTYAVGRDNETVHLTWRSSIEHGSGDTFAIDYIYTDAVSGELVMIDPQLHTGKNRRTYDANGEAYNSRKMPGTLVCTESNTNCGPQDAQDAHDYAGVTYDYFATKFGRDSLDNNGMDLVSSVNVCGSRRCPNNWNNAAWFNNQMLYGEGDGSTFSPLSGDLDVVAHELTHGVTDFTSDLIYRDQSGALNEALSDIFGASAEAWNEGGINGNTWKLGEDIYTPGAPGDALRYMNNPTLDGQSTDYFPDRVYEGTSTDNGGVHLNSGIFNLAYVLLVEGGSHPRGVTSTNVSGIGMDKAEQIYYHANVNYFTSSTGYDAALAALSQSALDLYGTAERDAVVASYCAVGVGSNCDGGNTGGNNTPTASFSSDCTDLSCTFTDSSSDSDGSIASRSWNFGDGSSSTATNPSHTYASAGTYSVTLTVTDNEGASNSTSQSVTVADGSTGGTDTTPPVISNVGSTQTGGRTFTVNWTTDEPTTGVVTIGSTTASSDTLSTSHSVSFSGARKRRSYSYTITATDAAGNDSTASGTHNQN